jgi:hypothetical protein
MTLKRSNEYTNLEPAKRAKIYPRSRPRITAFKLPGLELDTKLTVFDDEYHVHLIVLKVNSSFFRTFLESADKDGSAASSTTASGRFKYESFGIIDDDGYSGTDVSSDWHLVCDNAQVSVGLIPMCCFKADNYLL